MGHIFAKIGVLVVISSIPLLMIQGWFLWPIWFRWFFSGEISYLTWHILMNGPTIAVTIVGLTLYIIGRRSFWEKTKWNQTMLILGVILGILGVVADFWNREGFSEMVDRPMFLSYPMNPGEPLASFLAVVWSSLWIITGALWFFDWQFRANSIRVAGIMMALTSFIVFSDISLFKVTTGGGTFYRNSYYFLGYLVHLTVSSALLLLTIIGSIIFAYSCRKMIRELFESIFKRSQL